MPIRNVDAVNKTNQFIELAGANQVVRLKNNGEIGTRSTAWNRLVSVFSSAKTRETNQRTAEAFKESILAAADEHDYAAGNEAYHPKDVFYQFVGLASFKRKDLINEVLNSGILNEELAGTRALTGRKIEEVIAQISNKGATHFAEKRDRIFKKAEEGLGLYRESEAKFREANFDRSKLEGINVDAYDETVARFQYVEDELSQLIVNLQQDLDTCIEVNEIDTAKYLLDQIKQAGKYQSQIGLFNAECKYNEKYKTKVENLEKAFEKAAPHLEAITLNFANLNEAQIKARDELVAVAEEAKDLARLISRTTNNVKDHLDGAFLDNDEIAQWQEMNDRFTRILESVDGIYAQSATAQINRGHKSNHKYEAHPRSEESHIAPSAVVKKAEIDTVEAKIARMVDEAANPGKTPTPKKSGLKTRVAQESLDQIKQKKKVGFSSVIELSDAADGKDVKEVRLGMDPSKTVNDDISEIDNPNDVNGIYDPKTRSIRRDTFSNLGREGRISLSPQQKAAIAAEGLATASQEDGLIAFENRITQAKAVVDSYLVGPEENVPLKLIPLAKQRNADLSQFTPEHKKYFANLISLRLTDLATYDDGKQFTPDEIESVVGKALRYVCSLSPAEVAASQARSEDLKNAGLTLLTSASGQELMAISAAPKNISIALSEYLLKSSAEGVAKDFLLGGGSEYGGQDAATIQRLSINQAILSLRPDARQLVFSDIKASNSPYRAGYLAAAALTNNPENRENIAATSATSELFTAFGNLAVQIGTAAGAPITELNQLIDSFNNVSDRVQYADITNGSVNAEALTFAGLDNDQAAKDMFNVLDGYIGVRSEQIAAAQIEEEARFQRQMEAERAAQNNPAN